ncbi:hypothetical protein ACFRJ9_21585 [Paenarthrobacter sp. NPDC056912]|uniref:hypothetical protein n=1 Tax=Paenarthrobacter sp. NPDC056912 TaxID=3345965 RepID=UPI0036712D0F
MTLTEFLPFAPVVLTGLFAFVGTWAGSRFSHTNEHAQWLRNEKMAACSDFLMAVERIVETELKSGNPRKIKEGIQASRDLSHARIVLVCPVGVAESAMKVREDLVDLATLIGAQPPGPQDPRWFAEIQAAEQKAHYAKMKFILETSKDMRSGLFQSLLFRPLRGVMLPLLRRQIRRMSQETA